MTLVLGRAHGQAQARSEQGHQIWGTLWVSTARCPGTPEVGPIRSAPDTVGQPAGTQRVLCVAERVGSDGADGAAGGNAGGVPCTPLPRAGVSLLSQAIPTPCPSRPGSSLTSPIVWRRGHFTGGTIKAQGGRWSPQVPWVYGRAEPGAQDTDVPFGVHCQGSVCPFDARGHGTALW